MATSPRESLEQPLLAEEKSSREEKDNESPLQIIPLLSRDRSLGEIDTNPQEIKSHKLKNISRIILAFFSAVPFVPNSVVALSGENVSALGTEGWDAIKWPVLSFPIAACSLGLNAVLNQDYFKQLWKNFITSLTTGSHFDKGMSAIITILCLESAIAQAKIGWDGFNWIATNTPAYRALHWSAVLTNTLLSFSVTFATRFVGTKTIYNRLFVDSKDERKQFHQSLIFALRLFSKEERQELQPAIQDLLAKYREEDRKVLSTHDFKHLIADFLNLPKVQEKLKHYIDNDPSPLKARFALASLGGIAGWLTYCEKFADGMSELLKVYKNAPVSVKTAIAITAGLPTGALYFMGLADVLPLLYDSLFRRDKHKALTLLMLIVAAASCATMFNVGTSLTKAVSNLPIVDPLPEYDPSNLISFFFPSTLAFLGAGGTNGKSIINYFCRSPQKEIDKIIFDDILFAIEQGRLEKDQLQTIFALFNGNANDEVRINIDGNPQPSPADIIIDIAPRPRTPPPEVKIDIAEDHQQAPSFAAINGLPQAKTPTQPVSPHYQRYALPPRGTRSAPSSPSNHIPSLRQSQGFFTPPPRSNDTVITIGDKLSPHELPRFK